MTPEEAIKILDECMSESEKILWPECLVAHKLGIEALKRCRSNYLNPQHADFRRLPGETEE